MAYSEAFWILTGTAAPVIALAAVVTATGQGEAILDLGASLKRLEVSRQAALRGLRSEPSANLKMERDPRSWLPGRWGRRLYVLWWAQRLNIFLQSGFLAVSLALAGAAAVAGVVIIALAGSRELAVKRDLHALRISLDLTEWRPDHEETSGS